MYKIKQKFTIEYELNFDEISKEEFEELGFIHTNKIETVIDNNLNEVKNEILKSYEYETEKVTFNLLKSSVEINNGNITSRITRQI